MKTRIGALIAGVALGCLSFASPAQAGSYAGKITRVLTITAHSGIVYTVFYLGGYYWGIAHNAPGAVRYAETVALAMNTQKTTHVGCSACNAAYITGNWISGTWTVWVPEWIDILGP